MDKSIGDRILVKGGMVCDEDAMGTILEVHDGFYVVHVDGDSIDEYGTVNENGDILLILDY